MLKKKPSLISEIAARGLDKQINTEYDLSFSEWLVVLRKQLRMTQMDLARRAKIPQSHLAAIELGKVDPQVGTLRRLFDALGCDIALRPRPRQNLDEFLEERARMVALRRIKQSMGTMALENQAPDSEVFKHLLEKRTNEILQDRREKLWNEKDE